MNNFKDIKYYIRDRFKYKNLYNKIFWYKKHTGLDWLKGQNFGDYLSLIIVGEIMVQNDLGKLVELNQNNLLAIGSILHFAKTDDVIWGSGINGKISESRLTFNDLDVRMVRGPLTKEKLENRGIEVESQFGDPALLLPELFPDFQHEPIPGKVTVLPNLNELESTKSNVPENMNFLSPLNYWTKVLREILTSELVLTSSLHGIVVSEAFDVPVRFVMPHGGETLFKYRDYLKGTGRDINEKPDTFEGKIDFNTGIKLPEMSYKVENMLKSFPYDLFE